MDTKDLVAQICIKCPNIPRELILDSEQATLKFGKNTLGSPTHIDGAVTVLQRSDIGAVLELANKLGFCVCPISTGNNWGYGSINPVEKGKMLVLNLAELKGITEIDKDNGLIAVEPGVTQQQLADYLKENNWKHMTPVTGAGPNCSILSNALERGYGPSPNVDHFSAVNSMRYFIAHPEHCHMEFYSAITSLDKNRLGDSDIQVGHSLVDASHKWGLGAYVDSLFSQSNLGIVSEMSIQLEPTPKKFCAFFVKYRKDDDFESAVTFIKTLLEHKKGELGIVNLMDKRRVAAMVADNPNDKNQHRVMENQQIDEIAKTNDIAEWLVMGSIYTTEEGLKSTKKYIKKCALGAPEIMFSDSLKIKVGRVVTKFIMKHRKAELDALQRGIDIMQGKPEQVALPLAYFRNPKRQGDIERELLPDQDECGLIWYAPLIPKKKEKIRELTEMIRDITPNYGIEPLITFSFIGGYLDSTVPIIFNINDPSAVEKAHLCADKLFEEGLKKGFVPYRLSTKLQKTKLDAKEPHWLMTNLIKQALDPNNVITPERYNPV